MGQVTPDVVPVARRLGEGPACQDGGPASRPPLPLRRLQVISGDLPLLVTELGLASEVLGELIQAQSLDRQLRAVDDCGCAAPRSSAGQTTGWLQVTLGKLTPHLDKICSGRRDGRTVAKRGWLAPRHHGMVSVSRRRATATWAILCLSGLRLHNGQ